MPVTTDEDATVIGFVNTNPYASGRCARKKLPENLPACQHEIGNHRAVVRAGRAAHMRRDSREMAAYENAIQPEK